MANVTNLSKGSKGEDVKKLQKALLDAGYDVGNTGVDGSFGSKTLAAVKQYQKDNGLKVDGIAGKNTLGALYATPATTPTTTPKTNNGGGAKPKDNVPPQTAPPAQSAPPAKTDPSAEGSTSTDTPAPPVFSYADYTPGTFSYGTFAPSENVTAANNLILKQQANKPGSYAPVWQDEADSYLSQYQNRDSFSYDFNSDALYQQYKDNYIQQGQMAMMDAMGQAAAMTGGYGNSYAQTVGQQAYNQQLSQLNDIMPELYGMAYDRYNQEGHDLLNQYDIYMNREAQEYGKYQDSVDLWYQEMNRLTNDYNNLYNRELNEYNTGYDRAWNEFVAQENTNYNNYLTGRSEAFTEHQNTIDRDYRQERDNVSDERWQAEHDSGEKDKNYNRLYNLINGTGYTPTESELAAAGMTAEEANALKKAYKNASSSKTSTSTTNTPKYETLDYESQQKWGKKFETATSLADVEDICDQMEMAGFNPEDVAWFFNKYSKKFSAAPDNTKPKSTGNAGGGGGGVTYMETR